MTIPSSHSAAFWLNLTVKAALVGLLAFGAFSGLQQFEGKALVIPVIWALRGRRPGYPYLADVLLTLPFLVDTAGNALDLYDTIEWWDDANHLVNWALLAGAMGAICHPRAGSWTTLAFVVGFGAVTAILWEIAEYYAFIRNSPELATAYVDTLGDLGLGLTGSFLARLAFAFAPRRRRV